MVGALIGDLAAWTWENDKEVFFSSLIDMHSKPSGYGMAMMRTADAYTSSLQNTDTEPIERSGTVSRTIDMDFTRMMAGIESTFIKNLNIEFMCEDLETYNGDAEHDMWVDYDYHENTDELSEWFDDDDESTSDVVYND